MITAAIIVAAGRGQRFQSHLPKAFVSLAGEPLLVHVVQRFLASGSVEEICVVGPCGHLDRCRSVLTDAAGGRLRVVAGGERRQDSVRAGLDSLSEEVDLVAVHDAARPLVPRDLIRDTIAAARDHGAAIAAVPVTDSVKEVSRDGWISGERPRQGLWLAQTPQCFRREILRDAYRRAEQDGVEATDDASLVLRLGTLIRIVPGDASNLKITYPEDLRVAEAWLALDGAGKP